MIARVLIAVVCVLGAIDALAQTGTGAVAGKPLYRDPVYDGAADPVVVKHPAGDKWWMFYTNRRAKLDESQVDGVNWVHGTAIGIAESTDGAKWSYVGTAAIECDIPDASFWAPDIIAHEGTYHMYLTIVPGTFRDWNAGRSIVHFSSTDLQSWKNESTLSLASERVIDANVQRLPSGTWRMWYNNEQDRKSIYYADSDDLYTWQDRGKVRLPELPGGEGPKVFRWHDAYWMVIDEWHGLSVYRSTDGDAWQRQPQLLLDQPGTGPEDGVIGQHADVVVHKDRAYLFYFTHPGRVPKPATDSPYEQRRSSIQVVELIDENGVLTCDRNAPTRIDLRIVPPASESVE